MLPDAADEMKLGAVTRMATMNGKSVSVMTPFPDVMRAGQWICGPAAIPKRFSQVVMPMMPLLKGEAEKMSSM
jgi:hypothetical protein